MSDRPTWLTEEYIQNLLFDSFNDKELKIKDFEVSSGSNLGDGYASQIFRIKVNTPKKKFSIIAKVLLSGSAIDTVEGVLNVYNKEKLMLQTFLPKSISKLSKPVRFFAEFYNADDAHRALFLEDLCEDNYQLCRHSSGGLDLQHSLLVMEALAKLHGTSFLVFNENPALAKNFEKYFYCEENIPFTEKLIIHTHRTLMEIMNDWNLPEEYKKKLRNGDDWTSKLIETWKRKEDQFNVMIQTDCWVNNLMFKYNQNGVESVKMVDFQLGTYHSFALDLIVFIFSSTATDVKLYHLNTLIDHYFNAFTGITGNIKNFNKERLWKEFNERLFVGFFAMICFAPIVMAPPKTKALDIDAIMDDETKSSNTEIYKNPKFLDCVEKLMPYFVQNNAI